MKDSLESQVNNIYRFVIQEIYGAEEYRLIFLVPSQARMFCFCFRDAKESLEKKTNFWIVEAATLVSKLKQSGVVEVIWALSVKLDLKSFLSFFAV